MIRVTVVDQLLDQHLLIQRRPLYPVLRIVVALVVERSAVPGPRLILL